MLLNQVTGFKPATADSVIKQAMEKRAQSFGFNTLKDWHPANNSKWVVLSFGTVTVPEQKDVAGKVLKEKSEVSVVVLHPQGATDNSGDHCIALWEFKSRPSALTNALGEDIYSCQTELSATSDNADIVRALSKQVVDSTTGLASSRVLTITLHSGYLTSLKGRKYPKDVIEWT